MISKSINNLSILGFMILLILLLLSAMGLFVEHYGFSAKKLYHIYAGDEQAFINPKSFIGILKSFSPHIMLMPLIFFILFHLGISSKVLKKQHIKYIAMIGFGSSLGDIFINFFIAYGILFAYLKILFMLSFEIILLYIIFLFSKSIFSSN